MSFLQLWMVSVGKRSLIYTRKFPVNIVKARKLGFNQLVEHYKEEEFINALYTALDFNVDVSDFDCQLVNELPVITLKIKDECMWPVIVIEFNSVLFCGLPLIYSNSKNVLEHDSIPVAFATLQCVIKQFSKDGRLSKMEEFLTENMPMGTYINNPYALGKPAHSRTDDSVISIKVNELISSGSKNDELVYGTVSIENSVEMNTKASVFVKFPDHESLNLVLSPDCHKMESSNLNLGIINVKLHQNTLKFFHFKCDQNMMPKYPFLSYNYKVSRRQNEVNSFKVDLSIEIQKANQIKFTVFNVLFKQGFSEGLTKVIHSSLDWGQAMVDKTGFVWILGNKLPKSGKVSMSCFIQHENEDTRFLDAVCNFKIENFNYAFPKLKTDSISINDHVIPNTKLMIDSSLTSIDYRLIPVFE